MSRDRLQRYLYLEKRSLLSMWDPTLSVSAALHTLCNLQVLLRYSDNLITVVLPAERTSLHINCLLINRYHEAKEKRLEKEARKKPQTQRKRISAPVGKKHSGPQP